ncbi:MAG: FAD-dependent oxidoreductase [Caldilineaceae bacterium]
MAQSLSHGGAQPDAPALSLHRAGTVPKWFQRYGYLIAISLFLTAVASRKVIFNDSGPALAILILCALSAAFITGIFFRGKSGWCSSICPLLPVQRIYGQTPFVTVAHAHCEPCLGCTKNCYDLSPRNAYLADLYDEEPYFALFRKAFVGFFPGFVLSFYLVPNPPAIAIWQVYALLLLGGSLSMGCYFLIEGVTKAMSKEVTSNQITVWFGALALNLYYWFNAPTLGALIAQPAPEWFVWPLRTLVLGLTLFWIYRTYRKESDFIEFTLAPVSIHGDQRTAVAAPVAPTGATQSNGTPPTPTGKPRLTIEPEGNCLEVDKNRTLLELCEQHGLPIEAGCRMGLCGADPVCVLEGMENLSKISDEERKTLERPGWRQRHAWPVWHVCGDVKLALTPERPDIYRSSVISGFRDKQVTRVALLGMASPVSRPPTTFGRHPHCEIHLIGRERHHLYNRMGITRLIYGRSAMQGLMLLPEQWYEDFNITCWLNTQVNDIDATAQVVTLGTGETLPYDRLILTTGSQSFVPPITGFGLDGSFVLRTADDAMAIRAYVQNNPLPMPRSLKGGLLGLEAAYGLHQLGLKVTVLERSALTRQLDQRGSDHLLAHLRGMGIDVQLQAEAAALESMAEERAPNEPARLRRSPSPTAAPCPATSVGSRRSAGTDAGASDGVGYPPGRCGRCPDAQQRSPCLCRR